MKTNYARERTRKIMNMLFLSLLLSPCPLLAQAIDHSLSRHDFFYAGQSKRMRMFIVKDGKASWTYENTTWRGEISDAILLSDGNILLAHQYGIGEMTQAGDVVWHYDAPEGTEIHTIQPIGRSHVVFVQNGHPAKAVVMELPSLRTVREFVLPSNEKGSVHGQFRNARLTSRGTLLVANMGMGFVSEYTSEGKEVDRWAAPRVWSVVETDKGNLMVTCGRGHVYETTRGGKMLWELQTDTLGLPAPQKTVRLKNGNLLVNNWYNEWNKTPMDTLHAPVQAMELTPDGKAVWQLCSWRSPDLGPSTTIQPLEQAVIRERLFFGEFNPRFPKLFVAPNTPLGNGLGIHPGRVAWVHAPGVASWDGHTGLWVEDRWNDQAKADKMVTEMVMTLTGEATCEKAWAALFRHFNKTHNRGKHGYKKGEKIAIKLNMNNAITHRDTIELNSSPFTTLALVRSLVNAGHVRQQDIILCEPSRAITDSIYNKVHREFPGVVFIDNIGGEGRQKCEYYPEQITYSKENGKMARGLAKCIVDADYVINSALLKTHSGPGVTLTGKNWYGATDINLLWRQNAHEHISQDKRHGKPDYKTFVDFIAHKDLGQKTLLFLIDGTYGSRDVNGAPYPKWQKAPFNGDWACSLIASQDPLACDAVAMDIIIGEWPEFGSLNYCDEYLREAATIPNTPSGTVYKQDGRPLTQPLGLMEHWNNAQERKYTKIDLRYKKLDGGSPTLGDLTPDFVGEGEMMESLLQMLSRFSQYMAADFMGCDSPNSRGEACGCFMGERTMESNEAGVRTNADLSMLCAFLVKHGRPAGVRLPEGVTWEQLSDMARQSLVFAYSTHKANRLKTCAKGDYWGSTGAADHVWESSLWALSVAWSAFFQWEELDEQQRTCIHRLLKAECDYELQRDIPTGYRGDTKAEENGWEVGVLAAATGLFPDDPLAPLWWQRMREFAINSYSHPSDADNHSIIDPGDKATVADLYRGPNLYADYTLQNHNLFHTSYQNVVMQELGEAALTLEMFQKGLGREERWRSNALMHHNREVMDSVLCWLALTDGELAMPNGNDWSLFLYDQITSYSTMATMMGDADALMLENRAWKHIRARQRTTADGSWLLRPDVQARRMGVQGHRVMMTYLMHLAHSTAHLQPTEWEAFRERHSTARLLPCQNVVRAFTKDRFTTFSWSEGLRSYTGYIAANSMDRNKTFVPFRAWNTGNLLGWYTVEGRRTDATPVVSGRHHLDGDSYTMSGELHTNQATLDHRFAIYSTPGNAVLYTDLVTARDNGVITQEQGGLTAISVDELTHTRRTLHHAGGSLTTDGEGLTTLSSPWLNIDDELGLVCREAKAMAFGGRANNNSVMTAKACPSYSEERRPFTKGDLIDHRNVAWYSLVTAETTKRMAEQQTPLANLLPRGWNGQMAADPDRTHYLLVANFTDQAGEATLRGLHCEPGAPVFDMETHITDSRADATLRMDANSCVGKTLRVFVEGDGVTASLVPGGETAATLTARNDTPVTLRIIAGGETLEITKKLKAGQKTRFYLKNNKIRTRNEN